MRDTSISRRRRTKLKLLVSFNGSLRRRPSPRKLRYVGGENHIVSVERNTSLQKLKSKIADLICPNANFSQLRLKYHVLKSFCGDDGEEEEPVLGLLESDDDLRCMIEEYETMELKGKLHSTRFWVFVCNANDGFDDGALVDKHVLNVNCSSNWFCEKTNGFGKPLSDGSDGDEKDENEKLSVVSNKYESKAKKLGDDFLRKMVLKKQLLVKNLDGSPSFRSGREQRDAELVSENDVCQSSPKQLGSELRSSLNSEPRNPNFGGHPFPENELNCKPTNGYIVASESSGKISPVAESNSGPLNAKDGNLPTRDKGSNDGFLRQSPMISGYGNGRCMLSSNQFDAPEKSSNVSCSSSLNWPVNELDPNCEFTSADFALSNRENIIPQHRDSNMVKKGLALPTCRDPLMSGICSMESSQRTESQQRGYGCSNCNHRCCLSEARNQRIYQYQIRYQSNVNELGSHQHFRLDYAGLRSSSNIAQQETPSRSQSATLTKPLSGSHYYEIQQDQGYIDHGDMFNPPYPGEENVLGPVGLGVPENVKAKFGDRHVADAGNDKFFLPLDADGNPLLGARAVEAGIDLLTSLGTEKIDLAGQLLGENSLHIVGVDGQTPLDYIEEPLPKNQGEVLNLSNSPGNPCDYIITELSGDNNLLDVKGVNETWSMFQGGAKGLKNNGASIDLSLLNLYSESSGKVHLPVSSATRDTFESFLKPLSDGLDLMDEEHINSGPKFEKSRDNSSDSSSNNVLKCKKDDDKGEASQQNPKSNSSTAGKDKNEKTSSCLKLNNGIPTDITTIYSHLAIRELQIIKSADLEYVKELGRGTYGTVYYGKWKGSDVAIKKIKPSCFTDGAKEEDRLVADFWKEAHTLGQLHHPNIVALYGVVTDGPVNCLATVTEYMVNGSLKQVLRRKDRTIDRRKRLIIAMDAAFGMEYLHGKNIVHFDLKSHNFLVNMKDPQRPICKIGDLGLSKIKQRTLVSGGIRGTIPWMAPELLSGRDLVSEKVDVFSFGIVMWELLTGEEPYGNMRSEEIIAGIIRGNLRPEIPSWCDPAWRSLMESCWSPNPDCRPSFSEISKQLRTMAASLNIK